MSYAMVEAGIVTNIIWLEERNAHEFAGAVPLGEVPAMIGDEYVNGVFTRDGRTVLTPTEAIIAALDAYVLKLELDNVMLTLDLS